MEVPIYKNCEFCKGVERKFLFTAAEMRLSSEKKSENLPVCIFVGHNALVARKRNKFEYFASYFAVGAVTSVRRRCYIFVNVCAFMPKYFENHLNLKFHMGDSMQ